MIRRTLHISHLIYYHHVLQYPPFLSSYTSPHLSFFFHFCFAIFLQYLLSSAVFLLSFIFLLLSSVFPHTHSHPCLVVLSICVSAHIAARVRNLMKHHLSLIFSHTHTRLCLSHPSERSCLISHAFQAVPFISLLVK